VQNPFEAGRTADPDTLARELARAPVPYLEGALANPGLTPAHLLLVFKNPAVPAPCIARIGRNPAWLKSYEVKAAVVMHPRTPRAIAMNLVSFLWWRDLVSVIDRAALAPSLRRTAERILEIRLQELALGEKIALARIASRGVINGLRREGDHMVARALLQNPRLVEEDALAIANGTRTPPAVLRVLGEDRRWSSRPTVQKALAKNPSTPSAVALRILQALSTQDLKELGRAPRVPALIKVAVQRMIEARRRPGRGRASGKNGSS
jgi:hypothetical protein